MTVEAHYMICRNCGSGDLHRRFEANDCVLDTCGSCSYVQVRRLPTEDQIAEIYRRPYFDKAKYADDAAARHEFRRRVGLLESRGLDATWNVLDYGCAGGEFVAGLSPRCNVWGVDYAAAGIVKAKQRYPALADRFGTLDDLPILGLFDAVTMWDVIEHVPSPQETLALATRHLKPGGWLFISTPNIGAPVAKAMGRRWAFMTPPEHLGFFNRQSIAHAATLAGFTVVDWTSRGKLVNLAFILYKAGRVFPRLVPSWLLNMVMRSPLARRCAYVPTGDIQYVVTRKGA